jgi:NAD(P)-dependent dehydrogenase (short-subunit alcohol dehydrogenase family)
LVVGRNVERGEKTAAEIRAAGDNADFISSDLRDASSARELARRAVELGICDILINNAGAFPFGPTHETTEELFDSVATSHRRSMPEQAKRFIDRII